jgi:hypothetical protein
MIRLRVAPYAFRDFRRVGSGAACEVLAGGAGVLMPSRAVRCKVGSGTYTRRWLNAVSVAIDAPIRTLLSGSAEAEAALGLNLG